MTYSLKSVTDCSTDLYKKGRFQGIEFEGFEKKNKPNCENQV